jgi:hypothetical protein
MLGPRLRLIPQLAIPAFVAALIALALALPAVAAAAEFPLTIEAGGNGEGAFGCEVEAGPVEECEAEYAEGTEVTVIAEPELGSEFVEWGGDCLGSGACEVEMDAPKTIEVVFDLEEFELTVETDGSGEGVVECQVEGGPYELCPASETYPYGTEVILFAEAEEGSEFVEWSGDCSGIEAECDLTVEEPLGVTATFAPEPPFELTIETGGSGSGTVECEVNGGGLEECEAEYEEGDEVNVIAEPETGSEFVEWEGECDFVVGNECEVEMNADKTVEAVFDTEPPAEVSLTITKAGSGTGTVQCEINAGPAEACAASYPTGTSVKLKATADTGSEFKGFSAGSGSAAACSTSPCSFTITEASAVTATFNANPTPPPPAETCATNPALCPLAETCATNPALCPPAETCATNPLLCPPPIAGTAKAAPNALVKAGKAQLKLSCTGGACKGTLKLSAKINGKNKVIGKASFSLAAGASKTLKVKLSAPAKQELAKGKTIKAKLSGTGVAARTVKLKPAKKK